MKLAKASQEEIDALMRWLQDREASKFENAKDRPPAFMRVVFGYETLVNNCCDPDKDYLEWKPGHSPSEVTALRAALEDIHARASAVLNNGFSDEAPEALSGICGRARDALKPRQSEGTCSE